MNLTRPKSKDIHKQAGAEVKTRETEKGGERKKEGGGRFSVRKSISVLPWMMQSEG